MGKWIWMLIMVFGMVLYAQEATIEDVRNLKNWGIGEEEILKAIEKRGIRNEAGGLF